MKLALAMIVKGDDKEAEVLARCLQNVAPHVDGIFVTITQPNEKVKEVAELYEAHVSQFVWCNDFAAARNFNFSQVTKDYTHILWLDADDVIRGGEKLKPTIEEHPDIDAFSMMYLYAFDEWKNPTVVHQKTQIVKNDDFVEWVGQLHEDFKPKREFKTFAIKGVERLHLTTDERVEIAKDRNIEVAKGQLEKFPDDPRSYWNMANSYKSAGRNDEAIVCFRQFLDLSESDDEKYIVHLRLAECFWSKGELFKAIDEARYAIGIKPEFPDGYHLIGNLYFETKNYRRAKDMYLMGLTMKPPYYSIIVFNPRDYDLVPLKNLAKTYFNLAMPQLALECLEQCLKITPKDKSLADLVEKMKIESEKADKALKHVAKLRKITDKEKLRAEMDKIPDEFKAHPAICNIRNVNFIKETSTGKEVTIFCGYTDEEWTPETVEKKGIGGSEEAVIHLSTLLAEKGWDVTVYNNCGHKQQTFGKVVYKPFWSWNYRDKTDITILWRAARYLDYKVNSKQVYLDLHDVIPEGELTPTRVARVTKIFVKSDFHRSLFPKVADDKFVVVPNGIDADKFGGIMNRDPYLIINTSSPDRSLAAYVEIAKKVKAKIPEAKFKWMYGWKNFDLVHSDNSKIMAWKKDILAKMDGVVEDMGRVNHEDIIRYNLQANVWCYPTAFAEIDCISVTKAMAAGAIPVTTDFAALGGKAGHGGFFYASMLNKDTWCKPYQFDFAEQGYVDLMAKQIIELIENPPSEETRQGMRAWASNNYSWQSVADQWHKTLQALE